MPGPVPYFKSGKNAAHLNQIVDIVNAVYGIEFGPGIIGEFAPGGGMSIAAEDAGRSPVGRFRIVSEQADYLNCVRQSGSWEPTLSEATTDDTIAIAKWYTLQHSPWHGQMHPHTGGALHTWQYLNNQERIDTNLEPDPDETETQVVVNRYKVEQTVSGTIYAGSQIVAFRTDTGLSDGSADDITWMEFPGRLWAKKQ